MKPHKIIRIKPQDVGRFGIDEKNNLYWDDHLIHTESVIKLTTFQRVLAICAAFATILSSFAATANAWYTYKYRRPAIVAQDSQEHSAIKTLPSSGSPTGPSKPRSRQ